MKRIHSVALIGLGAMLGCAASIVSPVTASFAQSQPGRWDCLVADRLPDMESARSWEGASNIRAGLNAAAPEVEKGTILAIDPEGHRTASVICVKH
jgi:hypothetical protein